MISKYFLLFFFFYQFFFLLSHIYLEFSCNTLSENNNKVLSIFLSMRKLLFNKYKFSPFICAMELRTVVLLNSIYRITMSGSKESLYSTILITSGLTPLRHFTVAADVQSAQKNLSYFSASFGQ